MKLFGFRRSSSGRGAGGDAPQEGKDGSKAPSTAQDRSGAPPPDKVPSFYGSRQPVFFVNHGGGPFPIIGDGGKGGGPDSELVAKMKAIPAELPALPRATLVVTAHWEERVPSITGSERPELLYDYYGFPPEGYAPHLTYTPPGSPAVAQRARDLLVEAGFAKVNINDRPLDHGTFIPMKIMFPGENMPITQVSLVEGLDPEKHVKLGQALAPLRDDGVLIIGSGMSFHNMRGWDDTTGGAQAFDKWLQESVSGVPGGAGAGEKRTAALKRWNKAPGGSYSHPREEHLMPLLVCAGAGADDDCTLHFTSTVFGVPVSGFRFG